MSIKESIRELLIFLHFDISKNLQYDRHTRRIMKAWLRADSNCIDVGCHKGEILRQILNLSPLGKHFAFEPIPFFYKKLMSDYGAVCRIFPYALSDHRGLESFQHVQNAPAYSGLKERKYDTSSPEIEQIDVNVELLDNLIPDYVNIDFIKIDVEGGEFGVLKGGLKTIQRSRPLIIFECGLGASEYYGTGPEDIFDFLTATCGLTLSLLSEWPQKSPDFNREAFIRAFNTNSDYYFIAWDPKKLSRI
jgi:FkbM family methyltransferase